ncbi:MAG: transmembrane prediction, partial [Chthoniobacteraceae bacterium]
MIQRRLTLIALVLLFASVVGALSQWPFRFRRGPRNYNYDDPRASQQVPTPQWKNAAGFEKDVFTFVRMRYSGAYGRRSRGGWETDWPDADVNLSWRLQ